MDGKSAHNSVDYAERIAEREAELKKKYFRDLIGRRKELLEYHHRYYYNVPERFEEVGEDVVLAALDRARIAIIGDIHYSRQAKKSIRNFLLKYFEQHGDKESHDQRTNSTALALEVIDDSNIGALRQFVDGKLTYERFARRAHFERNWGKGFEHYYQPLFDLARTHHLCVYPLFVDPRKARGNLAARDKLMANLLLADLLIDPKHRLVTVVGDWHSSSDHLQSSILRQIAADPLFRDGDLKDRICSFYLNHERIWEWKKEFGLRDAQYFRLSETTFAIADTRPDVKYFSVYDADSAVVAAEDGDDDPMDDSLYQHLFQTITADLAAMLNLDLSVVDGWRDRVEIFTPHILKDFFVRLEAAQRERGFVSLEKLEEIKVQVLKFGSAFIPISPTTNWVFLSNTCTPNQYAQMATRYLRDNFIVKAKAQGVLNKFYLKIIDEGLRFIGNKLVNSFVECNELQKHERKVREAEAARKGSRDDRIDLMLARLVLEHLRLEQMPDLAAKAEPFLENCKRTAAGRKSKAINLELYLGCVRSLGRILGDTIIQRADKMEHDQRISFLRSLLLKDYADDPLENYRKLKYPS